MWIVYKNYKLYVDFWLPQLDCVLLLFRTAKTVHKSDLYRTMSQEQFTEQ